MFMLCLFVRCSVGGLWVVVCKVPSCCCIWKDLLQHDKRQLPKRALESWSAAVNLGERRA